MMKIVFDLGGVLLRWQPLEFMPRLLPHRAPTLEATRELVRGFFQGFGGDWSQFDRGVLDAQQLAQRIAVRTGLPWGEASHVIEAITRELQPLPDSVDLLTRLHARGCELYFLSNMPEPYARHIEATHAFLRLFRGGVYSSRVHWIKPEPEIFAHARSEFGAGSAPLAFVDDVASNVDAARAAGWNAIHFRDAQQCEAELAELRLI